MAAAAVSVPSRPWPPVLLPPMAELPVKVLPVQSSEPTAANSPPPSAAPSLESSPACGLVVAEVAIADRERRTGKDATAKSGSRSWRQRRCRAAHFCRLRTVVTTNGLVAADIASSDGERHEGKDGTARGLAIGAARTSRARLPLNVLALMLALPVWTSSGTPTASLTPTSRPRRVPGCR